MANQGIQIFDEGRRVVRPDIVQFLAQAAQTSQLVRMRKLEESKIPTGSDSVAFVVTTALSRYKSGRLWISFTLVNDGPSPLFLSVNDGEGLLESTPINATGSYEFDGTYPVVHTLFMRAVTTTAAVRIQAKSGEWK